MSLYKRSKRTVRDTFNWPLGTALKCKMAPVQFTFSSHKAISFIFQIYNFKFQINVGLFGATDVTKYLKLSKITNSSRQESDAAQKIVFHNFRWQPKILELLLMWKVWAYVSSVTINFGVAFRKKNIHAKMIFVKQKKLLYVYPVKYILKCFMTITTYKNIQGFIPTN